jgi:hypothetical protein
MGQTTAWTFLGFIATTCCDHTLPVLPVQGMDRANRERPPPPPGGSRRPTLTRATRRGARTSFVSPPPAQPFARSSPQKPPSASLAARMVKYQLEANLHFAQDTPLGLRGPRHALQWWNRKALSQKQRILHATSLDPRRLTKAIVFELMFASDDGNLSGVEEQEQTIEELVRTHLLVNKDFMAGVGCLFIAQLGGTLESSWHPTAAVLLALDIAGRCARYGKTPVIAECANQLVYRSGYLSQVPDADRAIAAIFVPCAIRELEHELHYDYMYSVWSLGSLVCLIVCMVYTVVCMPLAFLSRAALLGALVWLVAATRRRKVRRANAAYGILCAWALFMAWTATLLPHLKTCLCILCIFPNETLRFRFDLASSYAVTSPHNAWDLQSKLARSSSADFSIWHATKLTVFAVIFSLAKSAQTTGWPGLVPCVESFLMLTPLMLPSRDTFQFGYGLQTMLRAILRGMGLVLVLLRSTCCACCLWPSVYRPTYAEREEGKCI